MGASTTHLGNLGQGFTTLSVKNFFLISSLNLPSLRLKPSPLVLSQQARLKSLSPAFLQPPFKYWKAAMRSPRSLLLSRLPSPSSPNLSSQQRGSSPRIIAGASPGPAPTAPVLSRAEGSRAGCRTPGEVSAKLGRGAESPPSPHAHATGDAAQGTARCRRGFGEQLQSGETAAIPRLPHTSAALPHGAAPSRGFSSAPQEEQRKPRTPSCSWEHCPHPPRKTTTPSTLVKFLIAL